MSMPLLMVVQPLLDAAKGVVSGKPGRQSGDESASFDAILKGQVKEANSAAARKERASSPDESPEVKKADAATAAEEAVDTVEKKTPADEQDKLTAEEQAAYVASLLAAAAGPQIVPLEPVPGDDAAELAEDTGRLDLAANWGNEIEQKLEAGEEMKPVEGRPAVTDASDEGAFTRVQAEATDRMKAEAELETDGQAARIALAETGRQGAEQAAVQAQSVAGQQAQAVATGQAAPSVVNGSSPTIAQQLGTEQWSQAIGQRVLWMVGQEQQSASLTLNPPELGPLRVVVSLNETNATANFFSQNAEVRQALEGSLPRLREMMEGAGIQLGQAQVGSEDSRSDNGASTSSGKGSAAAVEGDSEGIVMAETAAQPVRTINRGLVDTFV